MAKNTKKCTARVCPTNINNAVQKNNLLWIDRKNGNVVKKRMKRGKSHGRARRYIVARHAISVRSRELYHLKAGRNGKLRIHRRKMKQFRK